MWIAKHKRCTIAATVSSPRFVPQVSRVLPPLVQIKSGMANDSKLNHSPFFHELLVMSQAPSLSYLNRFHRFLFKKPSKSYIYLQSSIEFR